MSGIQSGSKEIISHLEDSEAAAQAAREVILSPSTEAWKTRLNKSLSNPVWPHIEQHVGPLQVPLSPEFFCDSTYGSGRKNISLACLK